MCDKGKSNLKVGLKYFIPIYFILIFIWYIFLSEIISFSIWNSLSMILSIIIFFNIIIIFNIKFYGGGISLNKNNKKEENEASFYTKIIIIIFSIILVGYILWKVLAS